MKKNLHLDTNILIGVFSENKTIREKLKVFFGSGYYFSICSIVWHEFISGPLEEIHKQYTLSLVEERILPLEKEIAELATTLYNFSGRKKTSRPDCFIAASAIYSGAELYTLNTNDFKIFKKAGLDLKN